MSTTGDLSDTYVWRIVATNDAGEEAVDTFVTTGADETGVARAAVLDLVRWANDV